MTRKRVFEIALIQNCRYVLWTFALIIFGVVFGASSVLAQTSSTTARTPGTPAGSYALGDADTINLFTGNLNYNLPLIKVAGRGEAQSYVGVVIEGQWDRKEYETSTNFYAHEYQYRYPQPLALVGYVSLDISFIPTDDPCPGGGGTNYQEFRVAVNYVEADGTEHNLRDGAVHGQPFRICGLSTQNMGRVFESTSGNFVTYVNDTDIYSSCFGVPGCTDAIDGYLLFRDGTKSRVVGGLIRWTQDRNGNKITYTYENQQFSNRLIQITDSIGRSIDIAYDVDLGAPWGRHTKLTAKGFGGQDKIIRISREPDVSNILRATQPQDAIRASIEYDDPTDNITLLGGGSSPDFIKTIWLPDGRKYDFKYNILGQLARVDLPTGGAIEYDFADILELPYQPSMGDVGPTTNRVSEKRVYDTNNTLVSRTVFSIPTSYTSGVIETRGGVVRDVQLFDPSGNRLSKSRHYFYGTPSGQYGLIVPWWHGKETRTETFDANGTTMLRVSQMDWRQRVPSWCNFWPCNFNPSELSPTNNPFIAETKETLVDGNLVTKTSGINPANQSLAFDSYNNQTDIWQYAYGVGAPGALIKHTQVSFTNNANPLGGLYLLGLTNITSVYAVISGTETLASSTQTLYDQYSLYPLLTYSTTIGWQDPGNIRGNPTTVRRWLNTNNTWIDTNAQFDQLGNVRRNWDPLDRMSETTYDDQFTDQINRNTFAFPTQSVSAIPDTSNQHGLNAGFSTAQVYDYNSGLLTTSTDSNNNTTTYEYNDTLDRLTKIINPTGGGSTTFQYGDAVGNLYLKSITTFDETRNVENYKYFDGLGHQIRTFNAKAGGLWVIQDTQYDAAGRPRSISKPYESSSLSAPVNPTNNWVTTQYDTLGRITKITTADGSETQTSFLGNTVTVTDATLKKRTTESDALGRLTKVIEDPNGGALVTTYKYDILGNLREVVQGPSNHQQHRFYAYDSLSRLVRSRNPEQDINTDLVLRDASGNPINDPVTGNNSWSNSTEYLANGDIASKTDARGIKIEYLYDNLNRPYRRTYTATKTLPSGTYTATPAVDLYYDGRGLPSVPANSRGKLTRVASSVSEMRYTGFDTVGRVTGSAQIVDGQTYTSSYEYTLSGALKKQTYPSGREVQNTFDNVGDLSTVTGQPSGQAVKTYASDFNYTFTDTGATSRIKLGNQLWQSTTYNKRLQPTIIGVGTTQGATNVLKLEYGYGTTNNNGNVQTHTITVPTAGTSPGFTATQAYGYDNLNRLTSAVETTGTTAWQQTFNYDEFGNRSVITTGPGATTSTLIGDDPLIVPETNRITPRAGEQYSYDGTGNLLKDKAGNSYSFDGENMQATFTGPQAAQYAYDGEGRRIKTTVDGNVTVFVYDAFGKLIAEYATTPPAQNGTTYISADSLSTPRLTTDSGGNVRARHDYLPFGEEIGAYGGRTNHAEYRQDGVRQKFTGFEHDTETNLEYAQARYYASRGGRFTTVDPLMVSATVTNPQSMNRYTYALNSPYRYVDPTGMEASEVDEAFAELGALSDRAEAIRRAEEEARREAEKRAAEQSANSAADHEALHQQTSPENDQQGQAPDTGEEEDSEAPTMPELGGPIEVIIWDGTTNRGKDPYSAFGHVSYVIGGISYSWEAYVNPETGKEEWRMMDPVAYTNERRQLSEGRGYVIDLGSISKNEEFARLIINGYDGKGNYRLFKNNCGHAFQRAVNEMKLGGFWRDNSIRPSQHEKFIKNNLSDYVKQVNKYTKGGHIN